MAGVNKAIVLGRLGRDPEVKTISSGQSVAKFSVATSENWVDRDGNKQERTEWHNIVFWGKVCDFIGQYLNKGSQVYIEGRMTTRSYEDRDGNKKYVSEIVGTKLESFSGGNSSQGGGQEPEYDFGGTPSFNNDEEIPF